MKKYLLVLLTVFALLTAFGANPAISQAMDSSIPPEGMIEEEAPEILTPGAEVLLVKDVHPWNIASNESALQELGKQYDVVNSWNLGATDLSKYKFIMYASDQRTSYYQNIAANIAKIEAYVSAGGLLLAHVTDGGWHGGDWRGLQVLPGGVGHHPYWDNWAYLSQNINIKDPSHCVVQGLDNAYFFNWNYSTHGVLIGLPTGTKEVMESNDGDAYDGPTYIDYKFGRGKVMATMQTIEWGYSRRGKPEFLLNEIRCAQAWSPEEGLEEIEAKLDAVEIKLDNLRIPDPGPALDAIEVKLDRLPALIDALEAKLDRLSQAIDALESKLDQAAAERAALESKLDQAAAERAALESKLDQAAGERDALETKIDNMSHKTLAPGQQKK